ncbi:Fc.00g097250.m01.CDS01 [Cosmosporella sp. VM-42]
MDAGGLTQMSSNNFASPNGLAMPGGGLAARRGGQNVKPLSFESTKQSKGVDNGAPTPRTSRSHLLAGLRTAPKSATAASFGPQSPTTAAPSQQYARNSMAGNAYGMGQDNIYNAPKTAFPQYGGQNNYSNVMGQQYTVDQVLAPPELPIDEQAQEHMDPNLYAQLLATNVYLAQQQQRLQQQLRTVQAAAQQMQQMNLNNMNPQLTQQQLMLYEQQQTLRNLQQQQLNVQAALGQQTQQVYYNPMNGQYYVETPATAQMTSPYVEQPMTPSYGGFPQQQQHQPQHQQQHGTPSVQVSPPPESQPLAFRSNSPPKRYDSPTEVTPLPPPSANAFRRGHKKANSLAPINSALSAAISNDAPKSAGPKTASFPMTPATGGYGPGQARAGEHPVRQPRGPPSLDELKSKPTAKHEGSKNFATRTRRSAVHNLVRAGLERRKGTSSSCGSMSPVSETAEEMNTPITDNESDSGRSGSGSLAGEMECTSSRTSASSWGAIGSDRPSSRQKGRKSVDSVCSATSGCESENSSFANVFKNGALRAAKAQESNDGQRKAPRLVLTKTTSVA